MHKWYQHLSLRTKVSAVALLIIMLSLTVVAGSGILQIRSQISIEQRRSADLVTLGFARAAELALTVNDKQELTRLTNSFIRDENILFIAAYGQGKQPLAHTARDEKAWEQYQLGTINQSYCVTSERQVEVSSQADEFSAETESDAIAPSITNRAPKVVGRIVVGMSTAAAQRMQKHQSDLTLVITATAAFAGGLALFLILGFWMRRLNRLVEASRAISKGDLTTTVADSRDDEIGRLGHAFAEMQTAIRKRDQDLRQFNETLQHQVDTRTHDLRQALTAAEEANRAKSLFLANMSHELRTPLNGVIGMVDLLLAAQPNTQQRRYCDIAKASARSLVELINDILDFSKIEAGKLEMDTIDFDLHEVVEGVAQILGEKAQSKGLELVCSVDSKLPRIVGGDPGRLRQVILNLASNAVKFTERGEVVVDARLVEETADFILVRFSVTDSGIGIPKDRLERLFKSFSQVDASTTRKFGGTGLGLAISQRIAEMMSGEIGVNSQEGKGSTFWFTAKFAARSQAAASRKDMFADPRGLRVLAVDDNQTNREILQGQLGSWSLRADIAENAQQAIDLVRSAHESRDPYQFAFLDMHMPRTDGMELAIAIKSDPRNNNLILISLSSISDQISKEQMSEHGFTACLTKPVLPSQLYDTIVTSLAANHSERSSAAVVPPQGDRLDGLHVLLAEDNDVNRLVATELLQLFGCTCTVAVNGQEALDFALREPFDVILMDCQMPLLDGFQATQQIRDAEKAAGSNQRRNIIALTANAIKGDRELCLAAGMDDYLTKPIEPKELVKTILSLLAERRTVRVNARPPIGSPPPHAVTRVSAPLPAGLAAPVDLESLTLRCINNRRLAAKALAMFDGGIDRDLAALSQGLLDGNAKAVGASAHKIKGSAANISAEFVRKTAAEIEQLARTDSLIGAQQSLDQLQQDVLNLREYLTTAMAKLEVSQPAPPPTTSTVRAR